MTEFIKSFDELEYYTQDGGPNITYQHLLPRGIAGENISMGLVTLQGPTKTDIGIHSEWLQAYVVISGSGTVILGDKEIRVDRPGIINIPLNTPHGVRLDSGEEMQYLYVNNYTCK